MLSQKLDIIPLIIISCIINIVTRRKRGILVLGKHAGSKNDEHLVWKQLCARNKVFNRLICEPLARCAKRGSSLPLGTPMEIDFTSAYLHYPLPQCSKIVTPIIFSISYELFRLPSAKVPQDYQLLRTFVWKVDPEQWAISWYDRHKDSFRFFCMSSYNSLKLISPLSVLLPSIFMQVVIITLTFMEYIFYNRLWICI